MIPYMPCSCGVTADVACTRHTGRSVADCGPAAAVLSRNEAVTQVEHPNEDRGSLHSAVLAVLELARAPRPCVLASLPRDVRAAGCLLLILLICMTQSPSARYVGGYPRGIGMHVRRTLGTLGRWRTPKVAASLLTPHIPHIPTGTGVYSEYVAGLLIRATGRTWAENQRRRTESGNSGQV